MRFTVRLSLLLSAIAVVACTVGFLFDPLLAFVAYGGLYSGLLIAIAVKREEGWGNG